MMTDNPINKMHITDVSAMDDKILVLVAKERKEK